MRQRDRQTDRYAPKRGPAPASQDHRCTHQVWTETPQDVNLGVFVWPPHHGVLCYLCRRGWLGFKIFVGLARVLPRLSSYSSSIIVSSTFSLITALLLTYHGMCTYTKTHPFIVCIQCLCLSTRERRSPHGGLLISCPGSSFSSSCPLPC